MRWDVKALTQRPAYHKKEVPLKEKLYTEEQTCHKHIFTAEEKAHCNNGGDLKNQNE